MIGVRMLAARSLRFAVATTVLAGCGMTDHQLGMAPAGGSSGGATASGGSAAVAGSATDLGMGAGAPGEGGTEGVAGASGAGNGGGPSGCVFLVEAAGGDDANDGRTWASALASVDVALERASSGCEVWLSSGTYVPGIARQSTFAVPDSVTLRGGFAGVENAAGDRDSKNAPTILSGDLGTPLEISDNAYHVVTTLGAATLERITVSGGNADEMETADSGGGILAGGLLELVDVTVSENRAATSGGGVFAPLGLVVSGGVYERNTAKVSGGAISATAPLQVTIQGANFDENSADAGGAVSASAPSVQIVDSSFTASDASTYGGGVYTDDTSTLLIGRSTFDSNGGGEGGAIFARGPLSLTSSNVLNTRGEPGSAVVCVSTLLVDGGEFSDNEGGALGVLDRGSGCSGIVKNSTFSRNEGLTGAGAIHSYGCTLSVSRSSFDSNRGSSGGAVQFDDFIAPGHWLSVEDSVFEGNTSQSGGAAIYTWGGNAELSRNLFERNFGSTPVYAWYSPSIAIHQSRFIDNEGGEDGAGALFLLSTSAAVVNSEFARNRSPRAGAVLLLEGELYISNVTVAGNLGDTAGGLESYGPVTINNSIFWGNQPSDIVANEYETGTPTGPTISTSNFTENDPERPYDPHFVDPDADLDLQSDSPCIDTANDDNASDTDVLGQTRLDIEGMPTCAADAAACGAVADMGAYEYVP
jgi:hypothetical protein